MPSGKNNCRMAQRVMAKNNFDSFYSERGAWMDYVYARKDITHAQFRVAYCIASKTNPTEGCMWWAVKSIADDAGVSIATAVETIAMLDRCRLIMVGKKKIGRQTVDTYMWRMPLDAEDQALRAVRKTRPKTGGRKPRVSLDETSRVSLDETKSNKA